VDLQEGLWNALSARPEFVAKMEVDRQSYFWDELIRSFSKHIMAGTMLGGRPLTDQEKALRFLALEPRLERRALSAGFLEAIRMAPPDMRLVRTIVPQAGSRGWETCYVFLQLPMAALEGCSDDDVYRQVRGNMLIALCRVVRGKYRHPLRVVGIAMEPPKHVGEFGLSQDLGVLEEEWSEEAEREAVELSGRLDLYRADRTASTSWRAWEYPTRAAIGGRHRG
jgi:hypothetical protein